MSAPLILGVDPGLTGALAWYRPGAELLTQEMPLAAKEISGALIANGVKFFGPTLAVVEQVGARPGQGVSSMFRFGMACGVVRGALSAMSVPLCCVPPTVWKKHFKLGADKEEARALAVRLWPWEAAQFARKKDHGRAEAALIARWWWETQGAKVDAANIVRGSVPAELSR